jgi:hypothetical protein
MFGLGSSVEQKTGHKHISRLRAPPIGTAVNEVRSGQSHHPAQYIPLFSVLLGCVRVREVLSLVLLYQHKTHETQ